MKVIEEHEDGRIKSREAILEPRCPDNLYSFDLAKRIAKAGLIKDVVARDKQIIYYNHGSTSISLDVFTGLAEAKQRELTEVLGEAQKWLEHHKIWTELGRLGDK